MKPFDDWLPAPLEPRDTHVGAAAAKWMRAIGWSPQGPTEALQLAGDAIRGREHTLARLRHNARAVTLLREGVGLAILAVDEGALRIRGGGIDETLRSGDLVLYATPACFVIESDRQYTAVEITLAQSRLHRFWLGLPERPTVLRASDPSATLAVTMIRAGAELRGEPDAPTWANLLSTFEALLAAVLMTIGPPLLPGTPPATAELIRRAVAVVVEGHADPAFDAEAVADELSVPLSELETAMCRTGRTVQWYLRAARVDSAREMLARRVRASFREQQELAGAAGFSSAREMRRAIAEQEQEADAAAEQPRRASTPGAPG
ncbi:hypothetical protein [Rathayibacter tritici]|uniref:HTH araC/xylS-type domain-containing protein n=1 Tax=Rathayibacter tritici TaxID=33888 RepID=A0A160KQM2_9MICO|nr:hypothetical protein [Rathayibacter tritici]AND15298.1 hypothetical protein A6122_0132 [Rathayibacter tritici]PPF23157.1 hypothetical protein C5C06_14385 [Rathayibacter tritici]PPI18775.1 hypothetical protein C5D07_02850 [Rathayibacter tritici]PPI47774.1 hypothetical protein C5D18_02870 [Rathayibacter tritici]